MKLGSMLCRHCNNWHPSAKMCDCEGAKAERRIWLTKELDKARLRKPEPLDTRETPEAAAMRFIDELRSDYGTVTILPDNEEAETIYQQCAIECTGEWTVWDDERFYGESIVQCLAKAVEVKKERMKP